MKRILALILVSLLVFSVAGCATTATTAAPAASPAETTAAAAAETTAAAATKEYTIVTVPKVENLAWFQRMKVGVEQFAADTGVNAYQQGPEKADGALQAQIIEDLIAQKVDAICVVPFSVDALEPVLKKAREAGIVVIAHEASSMQNIDYDIEAFDNGAYGEHFMATLGELMGGEGEYATMVGSLTSTSHNEWVDAAIAYQEKNFPNMKHVGDKVETADDQKQAHDKMLELLKTYPNLKGVQGSAMSDVAGIALAVEESGKTGSINVVGTSLVSVSGEYLENGSIQSIGFWDPSDAGYAMNQLALMMLEGKEIKDGLDLGVKGYNKLMLKDKVFFGAAWIDVTTENMADYNF